MEWLEQKYAYGVWIQFRLLIILNGTFKLKRTSIDEITDNWALPWTCPFVIFKFKQNVVKGFLMSSHLVDE